MKKDYPQKKPYSSFLRQIFYLFVMYGKGLLQGYCMNGPVEGFMDAYLMIIGT